MSWENNVRRVTPYVPGEQPKTADVIKLNTNENPYPPAPGVAKYLEEMDTDVLRKYPDPELGVLIEALSKTYGIGEERIFAGVGSDDVLAMSFITFFNSKKPVLFPDITYSFYPVWCELFNIPFETVPLKDFVLDPEDYKTANGGIVIANPNAPTGIAAPLEVIEEIIASNPDSVVIVDEAYIDFGGESALSLIDKYENLLVVRTFSKSRSLAGSRIGYAFGSRKLIGFLNDAKFSFNSYTLDTLTQNIGAASLYDEEYFADTVAKIIATRERTTEELKKIGFEVLDSSANFVFASHPKHRASDIFEMLKARNIFVRYFNAPKIDNYLRISIGTDEEMDALIAALKGYVC